MRAAWRCRLTVLLLLLVLLVYQTSCQCRVLGCSRCMTAAASAWQPSRVRCVVRQAQLVFWWCDSGCRMDLNTAIMLLMARLMSCLAPVLSR
jgi:hypothetical protein